MFRIRTIYDDATPGNRHTLDQVTEILRTQFVGLGNEEILSIPAQLHNPLGYRFKAILFVAEGARDRVKGFALLLQASDLNFGYLQYISAARGITGQGIGSALYERVREEATALGLSGLFLESLPDDPALCPDPGIRRMNSRRLKFYELYGARPIAGTAYETPLVPGESNPPYLVYDDLGQSRPLSRDMARKIVRAILERKYGDLCPPGYIDAVVESFRSDPVALRSPRYLKPSTNGTLPVFRGGSKPFALITNSNHSIHHVRERGYVESPVRISSILREILPTQLFQELSLWHHSEDRIRDVHDGDFVNYLKKACALVPAGQSIYPYVFPIRNVAKPPKELPLRAGYFCMDTFTPLNNNAYKAAVGAVDCALTGARLLFMGYTLAYALVRPPGHHAERRTFGGFCYFNNAAIAAHWLSRHGKVAVLDVDYHHGNGTQDIFYRRDDVLTVSLHGVPSHTYPYFSGFSNERGEGAGIGFNRNIPLPENIDGVTYRKALADALKVIGRFGPRTLVIGLGLDTAKGDPTGSWTFEAKDFFENGRMIGALKLPTLVIQEGGYRTRSLGVNAKNFFLGFKAGLS